MRYTASCRGAIKCGIVFWTIVTGTLLVQLGLQAAAVDGSAISPGPSDWPWWRGLKQDNISRESQEPPVRWSTNENGLWKTEIPGRGHGSPTLWGNRIFLPTPDEQAQVLSMLCLDRNSGRKLWETEVHRGAFMKRHAKNSQATATPACDGQKIFMPFMAQ